MLKKTAVVAGAAAGLMTLAPVANADGVGNDGVNLLNDNEISIAPINLCGTDVAILGVILPIASPEFVECVNAPVTDHPSVQN